MAFSFTLKKKDQNMIIFAGLALAGLGIVSYYYIRNQLITHGKYLTITKDTTFTPVTFMAVNVMPKDDAFPNNYSYSIQAPSAANGKTSANGTISSAGPQIDEIFYFTPGTHTVVAFIQDSTGTHSDTLTFTVSQTWDITFLAQQ